MKICYLLKLNDDSDTEDCLIFPLYNPADLIFFCTTNGIIYYLPISVDLYVIFSESTFNLFQLSTCTPFFLFFITKIHRICLTAKLFWQTLWKIFFFQKYWHLLYLHMWQPQPGNKQSEGFRAKLYVDWQSMTRSCSLRFLPMCLITGWATNTLLRVWVLVSSGPLLKCNGEWYSAKQHVFTEASYEISARID